MTNHNFHNLKINPDAKSSRFVVDLKQDLLEQETEQFKVKKPLNIEEKIERLAEIDYGRYFKAGKEKSRVFMRSLVKALKPEIASSPRLPLANSSSRNNKLAGAVGQLDQLALIALGKLLYAVLKKVFWLAYKICYAVGWIIMFVLRLFYFILLAIIRPIEKIFYLLFIKLQPIISKFFKDIPQGYQAKQAAAISMFARLSGFARSRVAMTSLLFNTLAMTFWIPACAGMTKGKRSLAMTGKNLIPPTPLYQGGVKSLLKPVLVFAGVLLIIVLPVKAFTYYKVIDVVKGKVLGASESAIGDLMSAGQSAASLNFSQAGQSFGNASNNFLSAQNELEEINGLLFFLASVLPDKNMQLAAAGKDILRAGELSANAGKNLSLAMAGLFNKENDTNNILKDLSFYGHSAVNDLIELAKTLDRINSEVIPEDYQKQFILLKQKAGELSRGLNEFISLADNLSDFLGASTDKRYLLIFQNNSELRASGGFIGSFALIDFSQGKIKNLEAPGGGSYDTEAGFLKKIKAPEPLSLVRADWHFWDANWWPDWPTTARKLAWFYENSDGSTVDGVISFTPTVIEKLLRIIGPIDLSEKYGLIFNADNFWLETQKLAEQKPDVTREPKKIIGDLMNKIIEELPKRLTKDNLAPLFKAIEESLAGKNILFYFRDENLQAKADALGWSGRIKNTDGDYLSVINSNIAGGKSDRKIKQEIIHKAEIQPDGTIIDNLTIRRVHEAVKREPFSGVRNVDWVRVYVPLGSELIEASGFKPVDKIFFDKEIVGLEDDPDVLAGEGQARTDELTGTKIYSELNKTVFANWSQLDPGETIEINLKYKLPFKLTDEKRPANEEFKDQLIAKAGAVLNPDEKSLYSYSLLAQKQPGMNSSIIESELKLSDNFGSVWQYPASLGVNQNGWLITEDFNQDKIMGIIVEEK